MSEGLLFIHLHGGVGQGVLLTAVVRELGKLWERFIIAEMHVVVRG
jgi:hypothetical protein